MKNLKVGMEFTASDGRRGVITDVRPECVFVRPCDRKAVEPIEITGDATVRGGLIMATAWYVRDDKIAGIWADSKIGSADVFASIGEEVR